MTISSPSTDRLLDERTAALILNCSVALVRKMRLKGDGPSHFKIGRLVRYREAELASFIEASRVKGA